MYCWKNLRFGFLGVVVLVVVEVVVVVDDCARLRGAIREAPIEAATSSAAARFIDVLLRERRSWSSEKDEFREKPPYSSDGDVQCQGAREADGASGEGPGGREPGA